MDTISVAVGTCETEVAVKHAVKGARHSTPGERILTQCRKRVAVQLIKECDYQTTTGIIRKQ